MPLYAFEGRSPVVHETACVAPSADLIGDVTVGAGASAWFGAVLRADFGAIGISEGAIVQDGSALHAGPHQRVDVGAGATIGRARVLHACTIGVEALVANHASVLDGARVGARALVAAGAPVPPGGEVPDGVLAIGVPIQVPWPLEGTDAHRWVQDDPAIYQELARRYRADAEPVLPGPHRHDQMCT